MAQQQVYNQIELEEDSKRYVTVNTLNRMYNYQCLPFDISTAPLIFQKSTEQVLQGLAGVQVYSDNILITGKDGTEHQKISYNGVPLADSVGDSNPIVEANTFDGYPLSR